jgi:hypothetical protein
MLQLVRKAEKESRLQQVMTVMTIRKENSIIKRKTNATSTHATRNNFAALKKQLEKGFKQIQLRKTTYERWYP